MNEPHPLDYKSFPLSKCILQAYYDDITRTLWIKFRSGAPHPYQFAGVPKAKWMGFLAAASKGTYYHQHIAGRYQTSSVRK